MPVTPHQIMIARKLTRLTIIELSRNAGVSPSTLSRVESGRSTQQLILYVLQKALEAAGAEFRVDGTVTIRCGDPARGASDPSPTQRAATEVATVEAKGMLTLPDQTHA